MSSTVRERHLAEVAVWYAKAEGCEHPECEAAHTHGQDHQIMEVGPDAPRVQALLGGRGAGKTTAGSAFGLSQIARRPTVDGLLVGPTYIDIRRVMLEGRNGLVTVLDRLGLVADYNAAELVVKTAYGSTLRGIPTTSIERARGPEGGWCWWDEAAFSAGVHLPVDDPASPWSTVQNALRLGRDQQVLLTGTPRPVRLIREVLRAPGTRTHVAPTWTNRYLPEEFRARAQAAGGTRLGRQEYAGELIDAVDGSAWAWDLLAAVRVSEDAVPTKGRTAMAVDPSVVGGAGNDETGILIGRVHDSLAYVVADLSGLHTISGESPWPEIVAAGAVKYGVTEIHVETDNGGDALIRLVKEALQRIGQGHVRVVSAKASRRARTDVSAGHTASAKFARALASAARYGWIRADGHLVGGNVRHVVGLADLELEAATFTADSGMSPGRLDALNLLLVALLGRADSSGMSIGNPAERDQQPAAVGGVLLGQRPSGGAQADWLTSTRIG